MQSIFQFRYTNPNAIPNLMFSNFSKVKFNIRTNRVFFSSSVVHFSFAFQFISNGPKAFILQHECACELEHIRLPLLNKSKEIRLWQVKVVCFFFFGTQRIKMNSLQFFCQRVLMVIDSGNLSLSSMIYHCINDSFCRLVVVVRLLSFRSIWIYWNVVHLHCSYKLFHSNSSFDPPSLAPPPPPLIPPASF